MNINTNNSANSESSYFQLSSKKYGTLNPHKMKDISEESGLRTISNRSLSSPDILVHSNDEEFIAACRESRAVTSPNIPIIQKGIGFFKKIVKGAEDPDQQEYVRDFSYQLIQMVGDAEIRNLAIESKDKDFQKVWMDLCLRLNPDRAVKFLNDLMYRAVELSEDEENLFRRDNHFKYFFAQYIQNELSPLSVDILKCLKKYSKYTLYSKSHPEEENLEKLNELTQEVLNIILDHCQLNLSESLELIFKIAISKTGEKFSETDLSLRAISSLLFLQGIAPMLVSPPSDKAHQKLWNEVKQEHGLILSRFILKLVNRNIFESEGDKRFNEILKQNQKITDEILKSVYEDSTFKPLGIKIYETKSLSNSIEAFLQYIHKNQANLNKRGRLYLLFQQAWSNYQVLNHKVKGCDVKSKAPVFGESSFFKKERKKRLLSKNLWDWSSENIALYLESNPISVNLSNFLHFHEFTGRHLLWIFSDTKLFFENEKSRDRLEEDLNNSKNIFNSQITGEQRVKVMDELSELFKNILKEKKVKNWNEQDVALWLHTLKLNAYASNALTHCIDGPALIDFRRDQDFDELFEALNIEKVGDRIRFKNGIKALIS